MDHGGRWFYQAFQFACYGSLFYRLAEYLAFFRFEEPWAVLDTLLAGADLHGMTILQAMKEKRAEVLDL